MKSSFTKLTLLTDEMSTKQPHRSADVNVEVRRWPLHTQGTRWKMLSGVHTEGHGQASALKHDAPPPATVTPAKLTTAE